MLSRRDLVGRLAAGVAGAAALAASGTRAVAKVSPQPMQDRTGDASEPAGERLVNAIEPGQETSREDASAPPAEAPWKLLSPLTLGATVAHGWKVVDLKGPTGGACVLSLSNERGRVQRIHLCRNDGQPQGLVYTRQLDLVVMNGGRGDLGTDENFAQAVAAVAHTVAANEGRAENAAVLDSLLAHAERLRRFSAESEWALR